MNPDNRNKKIIRVLFLFLLTVRLPITAYGNENFSDNHLSDWIQLAKEADAEFLGTEVSEITDTPSLCDTEGKADLYLLSRAGAINDTEFHTFYLIAKDIYPTGICLKSWYGNAIYYSNDVMDEITADDRTFRLHRFILKKSYGGETDAYCSHEYVVTAERDASCLQRGVTKETCEKCGDTKIIYHAPLGHVDTDGDHICNRCEEEIEDDTAMHAHWRIGDHVTRSIAGVEYQFTCIDENYSDGYGNHAGSALFLMDDVIPAGYGGEYKEEIDSTGHTRMVWYPGPIADFGDSNDYKYSRIRAFLREETVFSAADVVIGVPTSATGSTEKNRYTQTTDKGLISYTIGYQKMTERLFILSLEEAIKYRDYLWKFDSDVDNPEAVTNSTCGSYWLRTPGGTNRDFDETGLCYVVDLLSGNIHPESIKPSGGIGDAYIDTQTTVGVRPAFTLPNE